MRIQRRDHEIAPTRGLNLLTAIRVTRRAQDARACFRTGRVNEYGGVLDRTAVLAGGLLWVYNLGGGLRVYEPASGKLVTTLSSGGGHWNSPIVTDGRVALPEGDANDHATSGVLDIWR